MHQFQKVSLLVRLWVEIKIAYSNQMSILCQPPCEAVSWNYCYAETKQKAIKSASLWGCELKCAIKADSNGNITSASLWGCELKWYSNRRNVRFRSQPPCEAVSWNYNINIQQCNIDVSLLVRLWVEIPVVVVLIYLVKSASLWGCELKYLMSGNFLQE